jgi:2-polyprenyl-6-methoxyphenol hydroxylase-like FAD-dependent oxidoreductase
MYIATYGYGDAHMKSPLRIAIVGGGPGGLMLARLLQCRGVAATVLERDAHAGERPQGGSLDLHPDTGQRAMRLAGLEDAFLTVARPEDQGDRLYDQGGQLLYDRNGAGDDRPEVGRTALRQLLLDALMPGTVRWGQQIQAIELAETGYRVVANGVSEAFDIIVGADGAWSQVRALLSKIGPAYEGATMVELGFNAVEHPHVDALVGSGKMFAVGDNRVLIAQRNGHGHIRGYAGLRLPEAVAQTWSKASIDTLRAQMHDAFAGWAPSLTHMLDVGKILGARPLYALPVGYRWHSRHGVTLLGDAAHVMSPFSGEGVNLALADAADLADALTAGSGWETVEAYEESMTARAAIAAAGAADGLNTTLSSAGVSAVLEHYRERV